MGMIELLIFYSEKLKKSINSLTRITPELVHKFQAVSETAILKLNFTFFSYDITIVRINHIRFGSFLYTYKVSNKPTKNVVVAR